MQQETTNGHQFGRGRGKAGKKIIHFLVGIKTGCLQPCFSFVSLRVHSRFN